MLPHFLFSIVIWHIFGLDL